MAKNPEQQGIHPVINTRLRKIQKMVADLEEQTGKNTLSAQVLKQLSAALQELRADALQSYPTPDLVRAGTSPSRRGKTRSPALQESMLENRRDEDRFRTTMDSMLEGCQIIGRDWRYIYINSAAERHNHRPKGELIGQCYMDMWPGIQSTHVFEVIRACLEQGTAATLENEFTYPDGSTGWFNLSIQPCPEGVFILSEDLTARKNAEQALIDNEQRFRKALQNTPIMVATLDRDLRYTWVFNPLGGYTSEELLGKRVGLSTDEKTRERILESLQRVINEGISTDWEISFTGASGLMYSESHAEPLRDRDGKTIGVALSSIDITEIKKAELALRSSENRLRQVFDSKLLGVIYWNVDGGITDANDKFLEMTGYTREDLLQGRIDWAAMTPPEYRYLDDNSLKELKADGTNQVPFEKEFICKDGARLSVLLAGSMLDEARTHGVAFVADVTAHRQVEKTLMLRNEISLILAEAGSLDEATPRLLELICRRLGWLVGEMWLMDPQTGTIQQAATWQIPQTGLKEILAQGKALELKPGEGFPGELWISARPRWLSENEFLDRYSHIQALHTAGINSVFGFPINLGAEVLAVMIFASKDTRPPDENMLLTAESIGSQVGQFIQRRQAEQALRESEAKFSTVFDKAPFGLSLARIKDGTMINVNQAWERITGFSREQALGRTTVELGMKPSQEQRAHIMAELQAGRSVSGIEVTFITQTGETRVVSVNADALTLGGERYLLSSNEDITERKKAEAALLEASLLKQASQYARSLIEVSIDPLVTISPEGKITDVNEATVKATGVPREELIGTNFSSYFTEPDMAERGYKRVFEQGLVMDYPLTIRHRDGHLIEVLYNASLYRDPDGNVKGVFAAARDVTTLKNVERELLEHKQNLELLVRERTSDLEKANSELAQSNENLEQFAYVASHDLQEPLRIMASYSQLLEKRYKGRLDQDADDFIAFIVDAAARMQRLITDLLAYSRAGREKTNLVKVDCNKVMRTLLEGISATIRETQAEVTFDPLPVIMAHEGSLIQLFQNLIGNAIKFRGKEPPCIHVQAEQGSGKWTFSVSDNGIGIEPQYKDRIFLIFQRLHPREKYPGTGIGLSICKKIVETMGGEIWLESEPGRGSTFFFTLPALDEDASGLE